jgi:N-hydroxyarylamine O-acetyltransferase
MDAVQEYLDYIGITEAREPDLDFLHELHSKHLLTVPFENLDIRNGRPIDINEQSFVDKILHRKRGGFCYELNGAFAWLLEQLGYKVSRLSARVGRAVGDYGPEFDHLTLLVHLEEDHIADVGYGTSSQYPLPMNGTLVPNTLKTYRIHRTDDGMYMYQSLENGDWHIEYLFTLTDHPLQSFSDMCTYHQSSPESPFVRGSMLCTKATPTGRIWIRSDKFIEQTSAGETERVIDSVERDRLLKEYFAIDLTEQ